VTRSPLDELFDETVALYLRLSAVAAAMYGHGEVSGPRRTLLMAIDRAATPQTVAELARARAQSRQRLQPLVNALVAEGLLAFTDNPAHKRSPLVVLTARGRSTVAAIQRTERANRRRLRLPISSGRLAAAAAVLRDVRGALERYSPQTTRDSRQK